MTPAKHTLKVSSENFERELEAAIREIKDYCEDGEKWIDVIDDAKRTAQTGASRSGSDSARIIDIIGEDGSQLRFIYSIDYDEDTTVQHVSCSTSAPILLKPQHVEKVVGRLFDLGNKKPMLISHMHRNGILHLFRKMRSDDD